MGLLTDLSTVKTSLGIPTSVTTLDALLNLLIGQTSALIEEECDRTFGAATYTEFYAGNNTQYLVLNQRPVTAIAALYLDELAYWGDAPPPPLAAFGAGTLLAEGVDYALRRDQPDGSSRSGLVFKISGSWPTLTTYRPGLITPQLGPDVGNVRVTYTAGHASIPAPITLACNLLIAKVRKSLPQGAMLQSESYEEYAYSLAPQLRAGLLGDDVRSVLARYRNIAVG